MPNRCLSLSLALAGLSLLASGCGANQEPAPALVTVVDGDAPPVLIDSYRAGGRSVPFTDLLIRYSGSAPKRIVAEFTSTFDVLPVPGKAGVQSVLGLSHCSHDDHVGASLHIDRPDADSYEIGHAHESSKDFVLAAAGPAERDDVRVLTLLIGESFDPRSLLHGIGLRKPKQRMEISIQSRLLEKDATLECEREFGDLEPGTLFFRLIAVDDCDADRQGDFLLGFDHKEWLLLSGRNLETIGRIALESPFGNKSCELPDLDGDGVREVYSADWREYRVISPKARAILRRGSLEHCLGNCYLRNVLGGGLSTDGAARVLLTFVRVIERIPSSVEQLVVVDALTGRALSEVTPLAGEQHPVRSLACGRIPGAGNRRWLAYSTPILPHAGRMRLFVEELGVPGSTIEVLLPARERYYAQAMCAVEAQDSAHDTLAITVVSANPGRRIYEFDPILFLDVARCLESR